MAPLRRRRDDEFDFKRSAAELKDVNAEPWFLAEDAADEEAEIVAGRSARFDGDGGA
ncbi:MAG TPA: hypothetical protein VGB14_02790 [Acidimicrobiales bacterium]